MSSVKPPSVKEILYNCSMDLHLVNNARRDLKQTGLDLSTQGGNLQRLNQTLQAVQNQLKAIASRVKSTSPLKNHYTLIKKSLNEQQQKVSKLLPAIEPSSPKASSVKSDKSEAGKNDSGKGSESAALMRKALKAFEGGHKDQGMEYIRKLEKKYPLIAKKIFSKVWDLEGKEIVKKHKKLAHPQFGRMAFFGKDGRYVSTATRIKAIKDGVSSAPSSPKLQPGSPTSTSPLAPIPNPPPVASKKGPVIKPYFLNTEFKGDKKAMIKQAWTDTLNALNCGGYTNLKGKFVPLDTSYSVQNTIPYKDAGPKAVHDNGESQEIFIVGADCLDIARECVENGEKTGVLNMASDKTPGGGVRNQTNAQEEQIFQRSGAVDALSSPTLQGKQKDYYPLSQKVGSVAAGLYSPRVPIFRKGSREGYAVLDKPFEVNLLTVAAFKNPPISGGRLKKKEVEGTKEKIRTMLEMAYQHGDETVILSAFGCGAYKNPPAHMAKLFQEVIDQYYPSAFKKIIFAIIDDSAAPQGGNFKPFAQHFIQYGAKVHNGKKQALSAADLGVTGKKEHKSEESDGEESDYAGRASSPSSPRASVSSNTKEIDYAKNIKALREMAQTTRVISFFIDENQPTYFLSNFYPCKVKLGKFEFACAEAAYHAGRDPSRMKEFVGKNGPEAFKHRKNVAATPAWHNYSEGHMQEVLWAKFSKNAKLKSLLLATGQAYLVMHTEKDKFWGDGGTIGSGNKLGEFLMNVRKRLGGASFTVQPSKADLGVTGEKEHKSEESDGEESDYAGRASSPSSPRASVSSNTKEVDHAKNIEALREMAQTTGVISFFIDKNQPTYFLSNFFPCKVKLDKFEFACAEAAYQAGRDRSRMKEFVGKNGAEAFKHRKNVAATHDWHNFFSVGHMQEVLWAKFFKNTKLKSLLLATGKAYLVMHTEKDKFWGDGGTIGSGNKLGELLMNVRGRLGGTGIVSAPKKDEEE